MEFADLPLELRRRVFAHLPRRALPRLRAVCRGFRLLAEDRALWRAVRGRRESRFAGLLGGCFARVLDLRGAEWGRVAGVYGCATGELVRRHAGTLAVLRISAISARDALELLAGGFPLLTELELGEVVGEPEDLRGTLEALLPALPALRSLHLAALPTPPSPAPTTTPLWLPPAPHLRSLSLVDLSPGPRTFPYHPAAFGRAFPALERLDISHLPCAGPVYGVRAFRALLGSLPVLRELRVAVRSPVACLRMLAAEPNMAAGLVRLGLLFADPHAGRLDAMESAASDALAARHRLEVILLLDAWPGGTVAVTSCTREGTGFHGSLEVGELGVEFGRRWFACEKGMGAGAGAGHP